MGECRSAAAVCNHGPFSTSETHNHHRAAQNETTFDHERPWYFEGEMSGGKKCFTPKIVHTAEVLNTDLVPRKKGTFEWELDVKGLVSTEAWLGQYGLKRNKLNIDGIMNQLGFKHASGFNENIRKPVCSRYAEGLFAKFATKEGKSYNIIAGKDKLEETRQRLLQAVELYGRRMEWLTSESRRTFGVIQEHSICILLDINTFSETAFHHCISALQRVLKEQVFELVRFNVIRCAEKMDRFSDRSITVTLDTIAAACGWLEDLEHRARSSQTAVAEALTVATEEGDYDAIYLFTEGATSIGARELLKSQVRKSPLPIHVVAFNCADGDTILLLRDLARLGNGRFHAYAVQMELADYAALEEGGEGTSVTAIKKYTRQYGGMPEGAGVREDVILLFKELEETRNNLTIVECVLSNMSVAREQFEAKKVPPSKIASADDIAKRDLEQYMSSEEWLSRHGIDSRRLDIFDVLAPVSFKHSDGVLDLHSHPTADQTHTDAATESKLVNAKYCDRFAHLEWRDGTLVHVHVTGEIHRSYSQRMLPVLDRVQARIKWLQQGSRELFGTILEDQIYILIDTSASMQTAMPFVKDKIYALMQEQLRHKMMFNLVSFNKRVSPWKSRCQEVNESTLQNAWLWTKGLSCESSTNTLAALLYALGDINTQAIYLLTDGRPDHPPTTVLSQVLHKRRVPIHSISFNCDDNEANTFLHQLSGETGGRFHAYSQFGCLPFDPDSEEPQPWESEDLRQLRAELEKGERMLARVDELRVECSKLRWNHGTFPRALSTRAGTAPPAAVRRARSPPNLAFKPRPDSGKHVACHTKTSLQRLMNARGAIEDSRPSRPRTGKPRLLRESEDMMAEQRRRLGEYDQRAADERLAMKKKVPKPTIKKWLAKNGVIGRQLTPLDVLTPFIIRHQPTSESLIFDQTTLSVVLQKLLPGRKSRKACTNRQPPDEIEMSQALRDLEERLEDAISDYNRKLNNMVWSTLSLEARKNLKSTRPEEPMSFEKHRALLRVTQQREGWPCGERNVLLMEKEIKLAEKYISEVEELRAVLESKTPRRYQDVDDADDYKSHSSRRNSDSN